MRHIFFACLFAAIAGNATASPPLQIDDGSLKESDIALREKLEQQLAAITADAKQYEDALYYGELRAKLCQTCHGKDGIAVRDGVPNLAGQNPVYMVDQFNRYADGRRFDYWMSSLAKHFSDEDKVRLAIYYSQQQPKPSGGGRLDLLARGEQLFQTLCSECHGEDAKGSQGYAKLAGQRPEYIVKMLKEFQTASGRRYNPWMYGRSRQLRNDEEVEAVAAYLAQLP